MHLARLLLICISLASPHLLQAEEDKARLIRNTEALPAEMEQRGFNLPTGFSIGLFADESLLGSKPINLAFDAEGRLWVTCTRE